jgi:hypothetical protein
MTGEPDFARAAITRCLACVARASAQTGSDDPPRLASSVVINRLVEAERPGYRTRHAES